MRSLLVLVPLVLVSLPARTEAGQLDRLRSAQGQPVFVIDANRTEWQGRLLKVSADALEVEDATGVRQFALADVRRVDADGDSVLDGALKGVAFGAFMGLITSGYGGGARMVMGSTLTYGLIGVSLDALNHCKQTVYRGKAAPQIAMKVSW